MRLPQMTKPELTTDLSVRHEKRTTGRHQDVARSRTATISSAADVEIVAARFSPKRGGRHSHSRFCTDGATLLITVIPRAIGDA